MPIALLCYLAWFNRIEIAAWWVRRGWPVPFSMPAERPPWVESAIEIGKLTFWTAVVIIFVLAPKAYVMTAFPEGLAFLSTLYRLLGTATGTLALLAVVLGFVQGNRRLAMLGACLIIVTAMLLSQS